jgi:hypothetical protein
MATNTDKILPGYEQSIGGKLQVVVDHAGPVSYVTGGETYPASNLNRGGFDWVETSQTFGASTGTRVYTVTAAVPAGSQGSGVTSVNLKWSYAATAAGVNGVVIATAGSGQTNGTYSATASTGSATISYTIAGGALTAVAVTNPGSGYTAAPTFTIAAGGTPGTVTATVGSISGVEVASGTNLNATYVRLQAILY